VLKYDVQISTFQLTFLLRTVGCTEDEVGRFTFTVKGLLCSGKPWVCR